MDLSQVKCDKCEKVLSYTDVIYSTTQCGHLFHGTCLRGKSICPKCGGVCYPRYHRRVYPSFNTYNWMHIDINSTKLDGEDCSPFALNLGATEKDQAIYAARLYGKDDTIPVYYVPDERRCFEDITCTRLCSGVDISQGIEILDISRDKDGLYKSDVLKAYNKDRRNVESAERRLQRSESFLRNG